MKIAALAMCLLIAYVIASIAYVYRWRGRARYSSFPEYLRKSWPVFAPLNCLLYLSTHRPARSAVLDADYLQGIDVIRRYWPRIRYEALALYHSGELEATSTADSVGFHDLGFRTFYKRGWRKFYLKWYDEPHPSARRLCPETVRLLEYVPGIRAAMFSLLPPGAELSLHSDPMACSFRYHLGLETPNDDGCFINVDGTPLSWRNGKDFVFDETYPHYARNETDAMRLILMCDVDRPMNLLGRAFNSLYRFIPRAMMVPNTSEDSRGEISWLFSAIMPLRRKAVALKESNRELYNALKLSLNLSIVLTLLVLVFGGFNLAVALGNSFIS